MELAGSYHGEIEREREREREVLQCRHRTIKISGAVSVVELHGVCVCVCVCSGPLLQDLHCPHVCVVCVCVCAYVNLEARGTREEHLSVPWPCPTFSKRL